MTHETCINNVKLNLNLTSTREYNSKRAPPRQIDNNTYVKRPKEKFQRGSLENVSSNPWGEVHVVEQSSLRRSRSLAISRENIFASLDFQNAGGGAQRQRRSQLIPRAKLIDRSSVREHQRYKGASVENLERTERTVIKRKTSLPTVDYESSHRLHTTRNRSSRKLQQEEEIYSYASLTNLVEKTEHDSLDSNFQNKSSINSNYRVSYEDIPELSLPNYYPDSKYDTDNTDVISLTDNISCVSLDNNNNLLKTSSCSNVSNLNWEINELESISYDENIVLSSKKSLYSGETNSNKPKTIRGPTPYHENYTYKRRGSIYKASFETPKVEKKTKEEEDEIAIDYFETDTNFDEINLYNDTAKVIEINEGETNYSKENTVSTYSNIENNPVYDVIATEKGNHNEKETFNEITSETNKKKESCDKIKTLIEVAGCPETNQQNSEQYKTIVAVESQSPTPSEEDNKSNKSKQHSHNYLKEFLESQKGSKKPLQNFIAKKLSNLSRRNSKEATTSLEENQFHSLPDISISENLKKCEKIDRKLRKFEKIQVNKSNFSSRENRFIVNIGRHFDITANSNVPVDFEVKIAKVTKKNKSSKKVNKKEKSDEQLIEAVKNLKQTLHGSCSSLDINFGYIKPEIVEIKPKDENIQERDKEEQVIEMELNSEKGECIKEYKEKVDNMKNYWGKIADKPKDKVQFEETTATKCKIIDLQTKVEDVKKKFEQCEEKCEEKPVNKVTLVKQLFEVKSSPEKVEKISPSIKESCSYFEKSHFDQGNQFESLNPNIVEIIDKNQTNNDNNTKQVVKINKNKEVKRSGKAVSKSNSISYPEFDHVRYRVLKSDLFQKKIFANCEKESQFDGLMQYLQDYSFQELLIDNNIVIIEPIRSKVPYEPNKSNKKIIKKVTPILRKTEDETDKGTLRKHFFYHPIRVNKEVNDDELPNPDTVRQARQFFEGGLKRSHSSQNIEKLTKEQYASSDPDKDHCSATDSNSHPSTISDFGSQENLFESINEHCCEQQYVSEDILEKIREYGSTTTYYGGQVVKQETGQPVLTKAIMEEIRNNERKFMDCNCRKNSDANQKDVYQGVKFKLVKSNSCSSRLELVGTESLKESKKKFLARHKKLLSERNQNNEKNTCIKEEINESECNRNNDNKLSEKNAINECIKKSTNGCNQPKIIGEERKIKDNTNKMTQWGDIRRDKIYSTITYSDKSNQKNYYEYHNYDKVKSKGNKSEMEFEPYEVA